MKNQNYKMALLPGREKPVIAGHPWIFSKAIDYRNSDRIPSGELTSIYSADGRFLKTAFWNSQTSIALRAISGEQISSLDKNFFIQRFKELDGLKRKILPKSTNAFRLVYAESDWLPGLIVDRYEDIFVFQIHTLGMDKYQKEIISALVEAFSPTAIVERSDVMARRQDGLQVKKPELVYGDLPEKPSFMENGLKFIFDPLHGQKTGFFLDQRDARISLGALAANKRVLNLFSYTGAFSVHAAKNKAKSVTCMDISQEALDLAKENMELNGFTENCEYIQDDIFEFLNAGPLKKGEYEIIVCDPPALAKSQNNIMQASKAYASLNRSCMEILNKGGILVTSSCSGRLTMEDFRDILKMASAQAKKDIRVLKTLSQSADHTDRLNFPEGRYLKTLILEIL